MKNLISVLLAFLAAWPSASADEPVSFALANGLRVRLVPAHDEPRVAVILAVRAGFLEEPTGVPHVAHVTEHLAVFDLKDEAARQAVDRWYQKGQANGETLADYMYFDLHLNADELAMALKVQAGRLDGVDFKRETLARELPRTLQEIEFLESSQHGGTGKFVLAPFVQAAWHGKNDVPIKARTQRITLDEVRAFHARTFRPDRASLLVIGDFDPATARKEIEQRFGNIKRPPAPPVARSQMKPGVAKVTWDVSTRHLLLAWPLPAVGDPEHAEMTLAATALSTRLIMGMGKLGLKRYPFCDSQEGVLHINLQLEAESDADAVRRAVLGEVAALTGDRKLSEFELQQARAGFAMQLNRKLPANVNLPPRVTRTLALANLEMPRLGNEMTLGDLLEHQRRLEKLSAESVRAVIAKRLTEKTATIVHVEPKVR
jgi:zinc protease